MQAINEQMRTIYTALGIDQRTAGQCVRRQSGNQFAANGAGAGAGAAQGSRQGAALAQSNELTARQPRTRQGLVFVSDTSRTVFHPRLVQLGQGNLDFTEVVSGLKEGDRVVMLGALALQANRLQQQDRARANASPLGGGTPGPGGGGGGRGGRG
jgi:HlyD family secretion protein